MWPTQLAIAAFLAQLSLLIGASSDVPLTCAEESGLACGHMASGGVDDSSSLVQLRRQEADHSQDFPDFSKQWAKATDYVKSIAGGAEEAAAKATNAISSATETALTTLASTLDRTFTLVAEEAKGLQASVRASKPNISSGVASLLARNMKASIRALPLGRQFEEQASATFEQAVTVWKAVDQSLKAAILTLAQGLRVAGLAPAAAAVNSSLQLALANVSGFVASLEAVKRELVDANAQSQSPAALVEAGILEGWGWFRTSSLQRFLQKVNGTLKVAEGYTAAFPDALLGALSTLQVDVMHAAKSLLSADAAAAVQKAFAGAQSQAEVAARRLGNASSELIDGIFVGLEAAQPAQSEKSGAVATLQMTCLPLSLLMVALLHRLA